MYITNSKLFTVATLFNIIVLGVCFVGHAVHSYIYYDAWADERHRMGSYMAYTPRRSCYRREYIAESGVHISRSHSCIISGWVMYIVTEKFLKTCEYKGKSGVNFTYGYSSWWFSLACTETETFSALSPFSHKGVQEQHWKVIKPFLTRRGIQRSKLRVVIGQIRSTRFITMTDQKCKWSVSMTDRL